MVEMSGPTLHLLTTLPWLTGLLGMGGNEGWARAFLPQDVLALNFPKG